MHDMQGAKAQQAGHVEGIPRMHCRNDACLYSLSVVFPNPMVKLM